MDFLSHIGCARCKHLARTARVRAAAFVQAGAAGGAHSYTSGKQQLTSILRRKELEQKRLLLVAKTDKPTSAHAVAQYLISHQRCHPTGSCGDATTQGFTAMALLHHARGFEMRQAFHGLVD